MPQSLTKDAAMAEDTTSTDTQDTNGTEQDGQPDPSKLGDPGKAALAAERKARREAERASADMAARLKEFEDRDKTEAQKLQEAAAENARRASEAESRLLRYQVAAELSVPANLVARLQGNTKQELEADARQLLELMGIAPGGPADFDGGPRQTPPGVPNMNALIRQAAGRQ